MSKQTYYEILGVARTATEDEIKSSYRSLARKYHPDVNDSPDAEETFKRINEAYATLSDSLKRADYDQTLADSGVKGGARRSTTYSNATGAAGYGADGGATADSASSDPNPYRAAQIRSALARAVVMALLGALAGIIVQLLVAYALRQSIDGLQFFGAVPGFIVGGLWGADMNFKVESFLGSGWLGRTYTFARTVLMSLSLAYFGALLGNMVDQLVGVKQPAAGIGGTVFGVLVGAVIGSDGDTIEKVRSGAGRFNLFYTLIRGAEIGAIGALIGAALGGILALAGVKDIVQWATFVGGALGMIVGSIKPPNLAAYASYASASVKNIIVILMVLAALLVGLAAGALLGPQIGAFDNSQAQPQTQTKAAQQRF